MRVNVRTVKRWTKEEGWKDAVSRQNRERHERRARFYRWLLTADDSPLRTASLTDQRQEKHVQAVAELYRRELEGDAPQVSEWATIVAEIDATAARGAALEAIRDT